MVYLMVYPLCWVSARFISSTVLFAIDPQYVHQQHDTTGGDPQVRGKALANPLRQDPVHLSFGGFEVWALKKKNIYIYIPGFLNPGFRI